MSFTTNLEGDKGEKYFDENALDFDILEILRRERETSGERSSHDTIMKERNWKKIHVNGCYPKHDGIGPFNDVNLPGVWFYKMPHKVCSLYKVTLRFLMKSWNAELITVKYSTLTACHFDYQLSCSLFTLACHFV